MELENNLYNQIIKLSEEGDEYIDKDEFEKAVEKYQAALNMIPSPKYDWEASTWLYTALGDAFYLNSQYQEALNYFCEALKCDGGLANPFILLRMGQCFYETDNLNKAKEYLLQAYMLEGEEIFEEEDDKYTQFIQNLM